MKSSALAKRLAGFVKEKYLEGDPDMLEELGAKGEIERYAWAIVSDPSDDEILDIAIDHMRSSIDKREFFEALNTDRLAEKAKRLRKERPIY